MVEDEDVPALTIRYKSRKDAEMALSQGRNFGGANLTVTWHTPPGSVAKVKDDVAAEEDDDHEPTGNDGLASAEEDDEEENEVNQSANHPAKSLFGETNPFCLLPQGLDDLLNYEEDDEDEERSWRR